MKVVARLVIRSGGEGLLFLRPGRYVLGRGSDCDLILPSPAASRRHAAIELDESSATLVDLKSRNGTRVNGTPAAVAPLDHGSRVEIGSMACVFEWLESAGFGDDCPTPSHAAIVATEHPMLTPAEQRVLGGLLGGLAEKAIAAKLSVSPHTVHNHVKKIYAAFAVNSRPELLARFVRRPVNLQPLA